MGVGSDGVSSYAVFNGNPSVDPQFDAFQRQYGQAEADASRQGADQIDRIQRGAARQLPQMDIDAEKAQRAIGDDFLSRGVFSSGVRVARQGEATREDMIRRGNLQADTSDQVAGVHEDLTAKLADLRRQQAEQALKSQQAATLGPMQQALQAMLGG